jgi:hypothetical protein
MIVPLLLQHCATQMSHTLLLYSLPYLATMVHLTRVLHHRALSLCACSDVYPRSLLLPLRHSDATGVSSALGGTFVSLDALVVLVDDAFEGGINRKRYMDRATEYSTIALPRDRHSKVLAYFNSGIEEKNLLLDREAFDRYQTQREDEQHALEDLRASRVASTNPRQRSGSRSRSRQDRHALRGRAGEVPRAVPPRAPTSPALGSRQNALISTLPRAALALFHQQQLIAALETRIAIG